jgi:predicted nucleotidyltransferase
MAGPTAYADLNALLVDFVGRVRTILDDNFCGAYLQGSFAVGDADEHSDVDFIVATHDEVTGAQLQGLQAMHEQLHALDVPWAQHLEGSYVPTTRLRRVDRSRSPYLYLDNGAKELIRDNHCNTAVVRWSLREHGVVLAGPDPKLLVEPVSAAQLRREVRTAMQEWAAWGPARTKAGPMSRWKQTLLVLSFCRMLHTLENGKVASKRAAGDWARSALGQEWTELIQHALDDRPDPWLRVHQPAETDLAERTLAFIDYALQEAAGRFGAVSGRRAATPRDT